MVLSPQKAFLFIIPAYSCVIQGASILSQSSRALAAKAAVDFDLSKHSGGESAAFSGILPPVIKHGIEKSPINKWRS
jgi:hypothetical protein